VGVAAEKAILGSALGAIADPGGLSTLLRN